MSIQDECFGNLFINSFLLDFDILKIAFKCLLFYRK